MKDEGLLFLSISPSSETIGNVKESSFSEGIEKFFMDIKIIFEQVKKNIFWQFRNY